MNYPGEESLAEARATWRCPIHQAQLVYNVQRTAELCGPGEERWCCPAPGCTIEVQTS